MNDYLNDHEFISSLKILYNYMNLNVPVEKCDLIIGCGCSNLEIPVRCAELYHAGLAPKILFAGGLGKQTLETFKKSEAEVFRDIAIKYGVLKSDILIENKSMNTGDNFRFAIDVIKKNNIKADKILIVHKPINERRTLAAGRAILKNKELFITSPKQTFAEFLEYLKNTNDVSTVAVLVGDIQRIIIYPQFGWQLKEDVPDYVIDAYRYLKDNGFDKYIIKKEEIKELVIKFKVPESQANYFE